MSITNQHVMNSSSSGGVSSHYNKEKKTFINYIKKGMGPTWHCNLCGVLIVACDWAAIEKEYLHTYPKNP